MTSDFTRINQPRVETILGILAMIYKSAASQKASTDEIRTLMTTVARAANAFDLSPDKIEPEEESGQAARSTRITDSPHYQRINAFVAGLPRGHLAAYITHILSRMTEEFEAHDTPKV